MTYKNLADSLKVAPVKRKIYRRVGKPEIDEKGKLIYTDQGERYYFEVGNDGHEYPVILVPSDFSALYHSRAVGFPSGHSIGNGSFVRGNGAS